MNDEPMGLDRDEAYRPVPRRDMLPVPLPHLGPAEILPAAHFTGWSNWAHQLHVRDVARREGSDELWLATSGGVLRWYPGQSQFSRYGSEHGLPGNGLSAIALDGLGRPWCAPDYGGLYRFQEHRWSCHKADQLQTLPIQCLTTDSDGQIWAGTREGVYGIDLDGRIVHAFEFPSVEPPRAIAVTASWGIWACSTLGLFAIRNGELQQVGRQPTLLTLAHEGSSLWVGKVDGLVHIDLNTARASQQPGWPRGVVSGLLPTSKGLLAVCDDTLGQVSEEGWTALRPLGGRGARLIEDSADGVWVATHQGLLHWREDGAPMYLQTRLAPDWVDNPDDPVSGLRFGNLVQCLAVEHRESGSILWVGTHQGLFRHDSNSYGSSAWRYQPIDGVENVQALTTGTARGDLWLTSWASGVYAWQRSGNVEKMGGISSPVLSLAQGLDGSRWAVSNDGLYRSQGGRWDLVIPEGRLLAGTVLRTVAQTESNQVWLGTSSGLLGYDLEQDAAPLVPLQHPFAQSVTALAYDAVGELLWAGTEAGLFGLRRSGDGWVPESRYVYTVFNSGLASNHVLALAVDTSDSAHPCLWVGTACGLSRFQYEE